MSDNWTPRRRSLLTTAGALAGSSLLFGTATGADDDRNTRSTGLATDDGTIPPLEFFYANGLLDENGQPLTDESMVAVTAEPTAEFADAKAFWQTGRYEKGYESDGSVTPYPEGTDVPLVAVDDESVKGTAVAVGSLLVPDGTQWASGNAEFLLNLWDETTRTTEDNGDKEVLFHEFDSPYSQAPSNQQYWTLERFGRFRQYAEKRGYNFFTDGGPDDEASAEAGGVAAEVTGPGAASATSTFAATLAVRSIEVVWITCPNEFREQDLRALENHLDEGGTVVLHDSSDPAVEEYNGPNEDAGKKRESDPSVHLNEIADRLGLGFRFNDGVVRDDTHNIGAGFGFEQVPATARFNTDRFPDLFEDRNGIPENEAFYHYRGRTDYPKDGDTYYLKFDNDGNYIEYSASVGFVDDQESSQRKGENSLHLETRSLGIDAPEDDNPRFERPVEWEGFADGPGCIPVIDRLTFENACSLVGPDGGRLDDSGRVAIRADSGMENQNPDDGTDRYVDYGEDPVPLVADSGNAVGIGALLVNDGASKPQRQGTEYPTIDFLLNVWDAYLGGGETVLYDESHAQPFALSDHAEYRGDTDRIAEYTIEPTQDLTADLGADAVGALWLTPPKESFTEGELAAVRTFVAEGGVVFLHGRSAATETAHTENLNQVAGAIEAPFRFNSDRVVDPTSDEPTKLKTTRFKPGEEPPLEHRSRFPYFIFRQTSGNGEAVSYRCNDLQQWAYEATDFAREQWGTGELVFELDPDASAFEGLGRILGNTWRAEDYPGGPSFEKKALRRGLARVYDSSYSRHDEFLGVELEARRKGAGLWGESDPAGSPPVRNSPVEELYLPQAASVTSGSGPLESGRAPVLAESTATQSDGARVGYDSEVPLVGLDEGNNLAMIGSPLLAESYEMRENDYRDISFVTDLDPFWVNTAGFQNFGFVTNLIRDLAGKDDGTVFIDGGHFQFGGAVDRYGGNYTLAAEDCRYFERFLEGVNVNCEGINDIASNLPGDDLLEARAIVVSTPKRPFTDDEVAAVEQFQRNGGAVILLGSAEAPAEETGYLNDLAAALGTDLRLNDDQIRDPEQNLAGEARLPTTTRLNRDAGSETLFTAAEVETWTGPAPPATDVAAPSMSATGSRADDGDAFTSGQTNRVDITVMSLADPVVEARIEDWVPDGWTVLDNGDAQNSGDVGTVDLGTVTRSDLESADGGITKTYFAEASGDTGRYTFGAATATAVETETEVEPETAAFTSTDTNAIVGVDQ